MCGIVGYIGEKKALGVLVKGLRRLEYRGYDSSGVAVIENGQIKRVRSVGKIDMLAEKVSTLNFESTVGIAHTRWATHGKVAEENAHPHISQSGKLAIVHNGIIENYRELKQALETQGVLFTSETDSEVLAHLIDSFYTTDLRKAIQQALSKVRGTYGIVVIHSEHPQMLVAARRASPLVIGIGTGEYIVASDATPILPYTKEVLYLEDGEVATISLSGIETYTLEDTAVVKEVEHILWNDDQAQKQGFEHFMLKEIFDQPSVFQDAIAGRYDMTEGTAHLGGVNMSDEQMRGIKRVMLIACGTASYAAMIGKFAFERLAGIPSEVEVASEFRYRDPIIDEQTLVFVLSQSGETADTLAALKEAKRRGAVVRGIVNVIGSSIARETGGGSYIHAGPELAVASTKAYTNMIAVLLLYALQFGRLRGVSLATGQRILQALKEIPEKMKEILETSDHIKTLAEQFKESHDFFFLGRGINYPVALEGSLKLKEISYIHSEAYPGGEMKHGPIALLSSQFPVFGIVTKDQLYEKMMSNMEEVRARKAPLIVLATVGDESAKQLTESVIYVPETMELLQPLLNTIPLQLFAYHIAVALGRDVDKPRNLAKSVTVE